MLIFLLLSLIKGENNTPEQKSSETISVHIEFIVYYKDGVSKRYGVNVDCPKGTTFKQLPSILNEKSLGEHYKVRFFEENGDIKPDIKIALNGRSFEPSSNEVVLNNKFTIKFITSRDQNSNDEL